MTNTYQDQACISCGLFTGCRHPDIKPEGDTQTAEILIVGEAPGEDEDLLERPFIGKSGQILRRALSEAGIEPPYKLSFIRDTPIVKNVVLANTVSCRPVGNATPNKVSINACFPKILNLIESMPNLKLIVPVGNIALRAFTGRMGIREVSGTLMDWNGRKLVPLIHPASVLHAKDRRKLDEFRNHVKRIASFLKGDESYSPPTISTKMIDTIELWREFYKELKGSPYFVFDIECTGLNPYETGQVIKLISFSLPSYLDSNIAHILPLLSWDEDEWVEIYDGLKSIFEDDTIGKVAHNIKFDHVWMRAILGIDVCGIIGDTMLSQYILYPNSSADLKSMAWDIGYGGYENILATSVQDSGGPELNTYAGYDSIVCHKFYKKHTDELAKNEVQRKALYDLLLPVTYILGIMEDTGIRVDMPRLNISYFKAHTILKEIEEKLRNDPLIKQYEVDTGLVFNPNSHVQQRTLLFDERYGGLISIKKTKKKSQPSTDKSVLRYYATKNNVAKLLLQYSDYVSAQKFIKEIHENITSDRKLHTTFWVNSTKSGRSSSTTPNLQNLPKGERDILQIRKAFIPFRDCILAEFDNSQIELRIMAEEAGDDLLYNAVVSGDVHRATAAHVLNKPPEQVTEEERGKIGKVMNFSVIYGSTEYGVARVMKCSLEQAREYLSNFFKKYYKTKQWMDKIAKQVKELGYVDVRTGFRRYFPNYQDRSIELNDHEIRSAINTPIQGLAGHILFFQLIGVHRFLDFNKLKSRLSLEIHDSLILNIHKDEINIIPDIKRIMETYPKKFVDIQIPIVTDVKVGESLGEMEVWKDE